MTNSYREVEFNTGCDTEQASIPGGGFMSRFLFCDFTEFQFPQTFSRANTCALHSSKNTKTTMTTTITQVKPFVVSPREKRKFF